MRVESEGGTHSGIKGLRRHRSGQPWRKYCGKPGVVDRVKGSHSRGRGIYTNSRQHCTQGY